MKEELLLRLQENNWNLEALTYEELNFLADELLKEDEINEKY